MLGFTYAVFLLNLNKKYFISLELAFAYYYFEFSENKDDFESYSHDCSHQISDLFGGINIIDVTRIVALLSKFKGR